MPDTGAGGEFTLSTVFDVVARAVPGREFIVHGDQRLSCSTERVRVEGFSNFLAKRGHGLHTEREHLADHESGQHLVGLYLRNGREYIEAMIGALRARAAPFDVNFRYVQEELEYLLNDAGATALVYHAEFASRIAELTERVPTLRTLIQVADSSGTALLPGAFDYETVIATPVPKSGLSAPDSSDLYVAYTGGTTGLPKGVLWRQRDIYVSSMGGTPWGATGPFSSYEALAEAATASGGAARILLPFRAVGQRAGRPRRTGRGQRCQ